jgi:hypothetical protein
MITHAPPRFPYTRGLLLATLAVSALGSLVLVAVAYASPAALAPESTRGIVTVPAEHLPAVGAPPLYLAYVHLFVVNLAPDEGVPPWIAASAERGGGIRVLADRALIHEGRDQPVRFTTDDGHWIAGGHVWEPEQVFRGVSDFSVYSKSGYAIGGRAPRSLTTFAVRIEGDALTIDTGRRQPGPKIGQPYRTPLLLDPR